MAKSHLMHGSVDFDSEAKRWAVTCRPHVMMRLKGVFSRIALTSMGTAYLKDSPNTCTDLLWFCERFPLEMSPSALARLRRGRRVDESRRQTANAILAGELTPRTFVLGQTPRPYQAVGTELSLRRRALLIADEMGLGKTLQALASFTLRESLPALVVVKVGILNQWMRALTKILPGIRVHMITTGTPTYKLPPADIYLTAYTRLGGWAETLAEFLAMVVFDEIHELRHQKTAKYAGAQHICRAIEARNGVRLGLSGSPIYNYGFEFFSIMDLLEEGCVGSEDEFIREWCNEQEEPVMVRDPQALGHYLREQGLMIRRTRADVGIEMPPRTRLIETVDVDNGLVADSKAAALELARLVLSASTFVERGIASREFRTKLRQITGIAKAPAVAAYARIFLEQGTPLIIFVWHREVYSILMDALKEFNPVMFSGSESIRAKEAAIDEFKAGRSKALLMCQRAVEGIDGLQGSCSTVIHAELDFSPQVHEQDFTRIYRPGQSSPCLEIFVVSDQGSDPTIARINGIKRDQSDGVLDPWGKRDEISTDYAPVRAMALDYLKQNGITVSAVSDSAEIEAAIGAA